MYVQLEIDMHKGHYYVALNFLLNFHEFVELQMELKQLHFQQYILKNDFNWIFLIYKTLLPSITGTIFNLSPISTTTPVVTSYE
jgi:hypothetical protein